MHYYAEFKTKPYVVIDGEKERFAINFKKELSRADTNFRNHENDYYNSDLFPRILNFFYNDKKGQYRTWAFVDELPDGFSIDMSKFLAVVKIDLGGMKGNK